MDGVGKQGNAKSTPKVPDKSASVADVTPIELPHTLSVRQLAELFEVSVVDVIKKLMKRGIMANINQVIDYDVAAQVAADFGYEAHPQAQAARKAASVISEIKKQQMLAEDGVNLKPRPPVITIMGHVDHGKTRLLDAIRQTNVMDTEAGGITQHIGAYQVEVERQKITFLDTPGHEAFTAMRTRGAQVTDITVLVVAADDGVKPQTLEAIDHARAARVPIVVVINKMDKPDSNPDIVKQHLVRADPSQPAKGVVIEAEMDKTKGPLATVLVHDGTLRLGDMVVVGTTWGRIKAMFDDAGKRARKAKPSTPVVIIGLHSVPQVGDTLTTVAGEHQARALVEKQQEEAGLAPKSISLTNLFDQISTGQVKELNIIFKTDVQGSIEPIKDSLEKLGTDKVQINIIHSGSGNITESDVMLAIASKGLVIAFNTGIEAGAQRQAEAEGIDIRNYNVIYDLVGDVEKALKGMLEPEYVEVIEGRAEVRAVYSSSKKQKVAGLYITEGKASRNVSVRVRRGDKIISESSVSSLRRFKDDVKEVAAGYECGIGIKDYGDYQVGDILEFFSRQKSG